MLFLWMKEKMKQSRLKLRMKERAKIKLVPIKKIINVAYLAITLFLGILGLSSTAVAQISVSNIIFHFEAGSKPVKNITVRNSSERPLYVTVSPQAILRPGFPDESRVPTSDLLITPKRFPVPAKGERIVRMLLKKAPGNEEQVFRASFAPQAKPFLGEEEKKQSGMTIKILTGVGILVFVEPLQPKPELVWERKEGKMIFRNTGNVNCILNDGKLCEGPPQPARPADLSSCKELPAKRLYPGNTLEVEVIEKATIYYKRRVKDDFTELVIPTSAGDNLKKETSP